ncbi:MAG TPA: type II and III secretion system protein family protein [Acidiphilium sp.]|nr:type II and III secretion system protein family protein [Acidiphilium sp.]
MAPPPDRIFPPARMTRRFSTRLAATRLLAALIALGSGTAAAPAGQKARHAAAVVAAGGRLNIAQGSGRLVTLRGTAANVFVADPKVVSVRPASAHTLFVFGTAPGFTTIAVTDSQGHDVATFQVAVTPGTYHAAAIRAGAARTAPGARLAISSAAHGVVVRGTVATPVQDYQVMQQAHLIAGKGGHVVNQTEVRLPQQVALKVRIAQMSRTITQQLGINWQSAGNGISVGKFLFGFSALDVLNGSSPATPAAGSYNAGLSTGGGAIDSILDALNSDNLAHILAEPTLTALSGQSASFIDGGSFPVPVPGQNGQVTVQYKDFGVQLKFRPVVLDNGSIILHVEPTVSAPTTQNAFQIAVAGTSIVVPSLSTQSASTTVVIGSGQTLAIAGLLSNSSNQTDKSVPGLGDIPVLGAAFRADSYDRQEEELVILVTPYLVKPVDQAGRMMTPDQGWSPPNQIQRVFLGRDNGGGHAVVLPGQAGFILR